MFPTRSTAWSVYYELAGTLVEAAQDDFDIGRGLGGARLGSKLDLNSIADFFRKAAEANLNAFNTLVVSEAATSANVSVASAEAAFADNDTDYALAQSGLNVIGGLQQYFGNATTSDYAGPRRRGVDVQPDGRADREVLLAGRRQPEDLRAHRDRERQGVLDRDRARPERGQPQRRIAALEGRRPRARGRALRDSGRRPRGRRQRQAQRVGRLLGRLRREPGPRLHRGLPDRGG